MNSAIVVLIEQFQQSGHGFEFKSVSILSLEEFQVLKSDVPLVLQIDVAEGVSDSKIQTLEQVLLLTLH